MWQALLSQFVGTSDELMPFRGWTLSEECPTAERHNIELRIVFSQQGMIRNYFCQKRQIVKFVSRNIPMGGLWEGDTISIMKRQIRQKKGKEDEKESN